MYYYDLQIKRQPALAGRKPSPQVHIKVLPFQDKLIYSNTENDNSCQTICHLWNELVKVLYKTTVSQKLMRIIFISITALHLNVGMAMVQIEFQSPNSGRSLPIFTKLTIKHIKPMIPTHNHVTPQIILVIFEIQKGLCSAFTGKTFVAAKRFWLPHGVYLKILPIFKIH